MMTIAAPLAVPTQAPLSVELYELRDEVERLEAQEISASTRKAYDRDLRDFTDFCARVGIEPYPTTEVQLGLYLADMRRRELRPATIRRRMSSISQANRRAGFESPLKSAHVAAAWAGIRREMGMAQVRKTALVTDDLRPLIEALPENSLGIRDRALLLVGFAGGFRRSEIVALDVADIRFVEDGVELTLRRSKTDQEALGHLKVLGYGRTASTCPVRALRRWLEYAEITEGAVFRPVHRSGSILDRRLTDQVVALTVKRRVLEAGLDPVTFSGHSLRAGFVTSAREAGAPDSAIMRQTGHKSVAMLARYDRPKSFWKNAASTYLGL